MANGIRLGIWFSVGSALAPVGSVGFEVCRTEFEPIKYYGTMGGKWQGVAAYGAGWCGDVSHPLTMIPIRSGVLAQFVQIGRTLPRTLCPYPATYESPVPCHTPATESS